MTDTGARTDAATRRALPSLEGPIPALFCAAGAAVLTIGALPWVAVLAGSQGIGWVLRALAVVAVLGGIFVLLVGIGLVRARTALRAHAARAAQEAALDTELNVALAHAQAGAEPVAGQACDDHDACASCDASCALNALRT